MSSGRACARTSSRLLLGCRSQSRESLGSRRHSSTYLNSSRSDDDVGSGRSATGRIASGPRSTQSWWTMSLRRLALFCAVSTASRTALCKSPPRDWSARAVGWLLPADLRRACVSSPRSRCPCRAATRADPWRSRGGSRRWSHGLPPAKTPRMGTWESAERATQRFSHSTPSSQCLGPDRPRPPTIVETEETPPAILIHWPGHGLSDRCRPTAVRGGSPCRHRPDG